MCLAHCTPDPGPCTLRKSQPPAPQILALNPRSWPLHPRSAIAPQILWPLPRSWPCTPDPSFASTRPQQHCNPRHSLGLHPQQPREMPRSSATLDPGAAWAHHREPARVVCGWSPVWPASHKTLYWIQACGAHLRKPLRGGSHCRSKGLRTQQRNLERCPGSQRQPLKVSWGSTHGNCG